MRKLLHIKSSPRGDRSRSAQIAEAFLGSYRCKHPGAEIDEIDLFELALPEFDGDRVAAKMSFFGDPAMNASQQSAWDEIVAITRCFGSADEYVFSVPMWNGSIPYRLKHYIDVVTQAGLLFDFNPVSGYSGLLCGKRATAIYTSGIYAPGVSAVFGIDHHSTYFDEWLRFIGISDVTTIRYQPNLLTPDPAIGLAAAREAAAQAGAR